MKRTLMVAAGVTALCGGIFLAAGLSAQQPQPAPGGAPPVAGAPAAPAQPSARPTTRIALLNLSHVVKNYKKFQSFQEEMKKDLQSYEQKDKMLTAQLEGIAKEINGDPATGKPPAANKDQLEQQAKNLQRQMEDNRNEAKKVLSKKSDDQAVILYKEVMDATQRTAVAHGIELVLHYNDSVKSEEYWSAANVMRKMQAGACIPLYAMPGMDISQAVLDTLNASYHPAGAPPAPPQGGAAPVAPPAPPH